MRPTLVLCCLVIGLSSRSAVRVSVSQDVKPPESASEILDLLLKDAPKPDYGATVPSEISGRVVVHAAGRMSGGEGVSVTDGYSVTKTDGQGVYRLKPNKDAVFIYITRPTGHDVQGHWYKPLAGNVDFELKPADQNEDEYVFVHVTDTHVSQNRRSLAGLSRFVREINALTPPPRFVDLRCHRRGH